MPRTDVPDAVMEWLRVGERGRSSEAIVEAFTGLPVGTRYWPDDERIPYDPDDLRRCLLLLDRVPEWEARMHVMASEGPRWIRLAERWSELRALKDEEAPEWRQGLGKAPRTYALLQELTAR